jgi:Tol biopolymer transport system component
MRNLKRLVTLSMGLMVAFLTTCTGTFELAVETTPGPEATLAALATENAHLATQVAEQKAQSNLGRLVYIQGGDVWVKELPDGEPQRFTDDGRNATPRWSPSGEWLTFRKENDVWVMRADGTGARRIPTASLRDYAWSPVADRLAYIDSQSNLHIIEENGLAQGEGHVLLRYDVEEQGPTLTDLAWSPNGRRLAYVLQIGQPEALPDHVGIGYVDLESGPRELYALPSPPQDGLILAGWTPDGQSILFWRELLFSASGAADGLPLLRLPLDGGEPVEMADFTLLHLGFWSGSPTGRQMALTVGAGRETWTNKRIALVDLETAGWEYLTGESVAASSPTFSPDGQHIAYVAAPDVGHVWGGDAAKASAAQRRIWVMNADGSDQRPLTDDPAYRDERPLWSAGGTHVLFARLDEDGRASLWLVEAVNGALGQVVDELTPAPEWFGNYGYIAWDQLFDWWSGSAEQPGDSARDVAPPPTVTLMPTPTQWFPPTATITPPPPATPTPRPPGGATSTSATAVKPLPAALVYRTTAGTESEIHILEPGGADRRGLTLPSHTGHREVAGHYLAYVLDDTIYLADLADGTVRELYGDWGRRAPDFDLCWSSDGRLLTYALAYEEADGSRMVELGTLDGYRQEVVTVLTARPAGPTPTPPAMPPIPPEPGYANLHLLGFDRVSSTLAAIPVGGRESHSGVWLIDTLSGERLTTIPLHQPDQTSALALSPDLTHLALCHVGSDIVQSRLELYDVMAEGLTPAVYDLPPRSHAVDLRWSPNGASLAYLLAEGQPDPAVSPTSGLWLLDVNRMEVRELLQLEKPEARLIGWAPDGKALLAEWLDGLSREQHHQLVNVATGQAEEIPLPSDADVLGWASLP